jgi:predicted AlkP superfamily phosphohydrolase/phosphomutase
MGLFDRIRGSDTPRVAFIGIDGVPYSLIEDNPDVFPNLTALAEEGSAGAIDSIVPPESSACWPALTTGKNPGETGVYGFQDREVGSYETYVPMSRDVRTDRIWDRVHDAGRDATVMNVVATFPPQRNVQRMVSGFLSPSVEKATTPEDFLEYLQSIGYRRDVDAGLGKTDKTAFIEDARQTIDTRQTAFEHYIQKDDWDLFFGVFMATDRVNHFLFEDYEREGKHYDEFVEFYRKVDGYVGDIREALADDVTLVVASDHGFTTLDYEFYANEWLRREGWLSYRGEEHDSLTDIASETKAYSLIPGRFYLNLEGREPRGNVPESEYERVRGELAEELRSLEGPDGESVIDRVVPKEDAFHGDHDDIAPDLVAIPNHGFDLKAGFKPKENLFERNERNGMHSFDDASLLIDDSDISMDGIVDLFDLTPTMMDLMEIDYDYAEMDGQSLVSESMR